MGEVVKREISEDGVLTVTLNRPESLNSCLLYTSDAADE